MAQFVPGTHGGYRKVSLGPNGDLEPRLGNCGVAAATAVSNRDGPTDLYRIAVDFSGFTGVVNPGMADDSGVLPRLIGDMNASVVLSAVADKTLEYEGWAGAAQSARIPGTIRVNLSAIMDNVFLMRAYVLCELADGSRAFLQYFGGGSVWSAFDSGPFTVNNTVHSSGRVQGVPGDANGAATMRAIRAG